jgi:hypothetical protein
MAQTIYKYPFPIRDEVVIELPKGAKVLSIQEQYGEPQLWALVDLDAEMELRFFDVRGTGHDADGVGDHVSSFQMRGGTLVFHVFERAIPPVREYRV